MELDSKYIFEGRFGLERETLRVTENGEMAQTPHPFEDSPYIDRDFCENQTELITPVCGSIDEMFDALESLDRKSREILKKQGEYFWLSSNPPHIKSGDDIPVARFVGSRASKREYREHLARRYGKRLMLYSGIHFNFSFSNRFIKSIHFDGSDYKDFKNSLYFRLSKQVVRYSWLCVLLTAASPVYDLSLNGDGLSGTGFDGYASPRSGDSGYWNKFIPILDYTDIHTYIDSITRYINSGELLSAGELYLPVRLKPHGENSLGSFAKHGTDHIELRMFDVNPLSELGFFKEDARFAHYFLIYLLSLPDFEFTPDLQRIAVRNHRSAARYDLADIQINGYGAVDAGLGLLSDMEIFFRGCPAALENIALQKRKLTENDRYCVRVYERYKNDFQGQMLCDTLNFTNKNDAQ